MYEALSAVADHRVHLKENLTAEVVSSSGDKAELSKENDLKVDGFRGGLGEFSVSIDGQTVIDTNRFWYSTPGKVVTRIRTLLATEPS